MAAGVAAYRGVRRAGDPYAVTPTTRANAASGTTTATGLTTTSADNVILFAANQSIDANSSARFSGWTSNGTGAMNERLDKSSNVGGGTCVGLAGGLMPAAGATGDATATNASSVVNCGILLALVPELSLHPTAVAGAEAVGAPTVQLMTLGVAAVATAEAVGTASVTIPTALLIDTFDSSDTTKWTYGAGATVGGGNLNLTHGSAYARTISASGTWKLTGSRTRIGPVTVNTTAGNEFFFTFGSNGGLFDATNQIQLIVSGTSLIARVRKSDGTSTDTSVAWTNGNWLQFRESGGTLFFETASTEEGLSTPTLVRSLAAPFSLDSGFFQVAAGNNTANTTTTTIGGINPSDKPLTEPPGVPAWVTSVGFDSTTMQVSWGPTTGTVTGFQIERDGEVTPLAVDTTSSVYKHTGLAVASQHSYRVRSTDGTNFSAWVAAPASFTTPARTGHALAIPTYYVPPFNLDPAPAGTIAVANPASGPGTAAQTAYTNEITTQHNAGRKVIGYVSTAYGNRARADVVADIDKWYSFYPAIDGIFLDEQTNTAAGVAHYADLYNYVRAKDADGIVAANPGTSTIESYTSTADIIMTFENTGANHATHANPAWMANYSRFRFWDAVHTTATEADMRTVVTKVKTAERNVGWTYVTDQDLPGNPWDVLAAYWSAEVNAVTGQQITASGAPSAETVGKSTLTAGTVTLDATAATSAEAVGTSAVTATVTLTATAVPSSEQVGAAQITVGTVTLSPVGVASAEAVGAATASPGAVTVSAAAVPSEEQVGSASITQGAVVLGPASAVSAEKVVAPTLAPGSVTIAAASTIDADAFGTPTITPGTVTLSTTAVGSKEAVGAQSVTPGAVAISPPGTLDEHPVGGLVVSPGAVTVAPSGVPTAEVVGTTTITPGLVTVSPASTVSVETVGAATVTAGAVSVNPASVASTEAAGAAALTVGTVIVAPAGVASVEAVPAPAVVAGGMVAVVGAPSAEAAGAAAVTTGPVTVSPAGTDLSGTAGVPTVQPGVVVVAPAGIASTAAVGAPAIQTGTVAVVPTGVASAAASGTPVVAPGSVSIQLAAVASDAAVPSPQVSPGAVSISPQATGSGQAFGVADVLVGAVAISLIGADDRSAAGALTVTPGTTTIGLGAVDSTELVGLAEARAGQVLLEVLGVADVSAVGVPSLRSNVIIVVHPIVLPLEHDGVSTVALRHKGVGSGVLLHGGVSYAPLRTTGVGTAPLA